MWSIFFNEDVQTLQVLNRIEAWKKEIFTLLSSEVKEYFAQKVVLHFDNLMIFHNKRGLHSNLMEALSIAEKEMFNAGGVFPPVQCYWLREDNGNALITFGLNNKYYNSLENYEFKLIQEDAIPMGGSDEKLKNESWGSLVFDIGLVNFAQSWINYTPSLEQRSQQQVKFILMNMQFKKGEFSLLEKINFEENIENHPQYQELYEKVLRVMPKIENSLEQEWRTAIMQNSNVIKKKTGII